jgi:hypothetical protein
MNVVVLHVQLRSFFVCASSLKLCEMFLNGNALTLVWNFMKEQLKKAKSIRLGFFVLSQQLQKSHFPILCLYYVLG